MELWGFQQYGSSLSKLLHIEGTRGCGSYFEH